MIRRTVLLLLALVLVTGASACGGGDDDSADESSDDDTEAESEAGQDETPDETATTSSTAAGAGSPEGEPAPGSEDAPGGAATELGVDRTFTGEGSDAFCAQVEAMQASGNTDPATVDQAAFADQMAAITPPTEIAAEWTNLFTVQQAVAADPSGNALAAMSQEELDTWGMSGAVVAAYLGDVCGFNGPG